MKSLYEAEKSSDVLGNKNYTITYDMQGFKYALFDTKNI